jgi:hypothetical protein
VDDVFAILRSSDMVTVMRILNNLNNNIQFTAEQEVNGVLPFLDLLVERKDGRFSFNVYRKPTHSGRYLHFTSEHTYAHKMSVISSLASRVHSHCSTNEQKKSEMDHITEELIQNGYPKHIVKEKVKKFSIEQMKPSESRDSTTEEPKTVSIPFINSMSQRISRALARADIRSVMKPGSSMKNQVCHMKDKIPTENKSNVVYLVPCTECNATYVGETKRRLKARVTEHRSAVRNANSKDSALADHAIQKLHPPDWDKVSILSNERNFRTRRFKEASQILNQPNPLNRNEGLKIPDIYKPILIRNVNENDLNQNKFRAKTEGVRFLPNW